MPLYDPVRDPNPSPTREQFDHTLHHVRNASPTSAAAGGTAVFAFVSPSPSHASLGSQNAPEPSPVPQSSSIAAQRETGPSLSMNHRMSLSGIMSASSSSSSGGGGRSFSTGGVGGVPHDDSSPIRSRGPSIADILNPTTTSGGSTNVSPSSLGNSHPLPPLAAAVTPTSTHIPTPQHQHPISASRQERSPSLQNILSGGEAGPIPKSRSSSIGGHVSSSTTSPSTLTRPLPLSTPRGSASYGGVSAGETSSSPQQPFATLLDGIHYRDSLSAPLVAVPTSTLISPGAGIEKQQQQKRRASPSSISAGAGDKEKERRIDGFAVPDAPASRSPDVGRNVPLPTPGTGAGIRPKSKTPAVSSVAAGELATQVTTTGRAVIDSEMMPLSSTTITAPSAVSTSTLDGVEETRNEKESISPASAPAAARRKSTTSSAATPARRKRSMVPTDEDAVPLTAGGAAAARAEAHVFEASATSASADQPPTKKAKMDSSSEVADERELQRQRESAKEREESHRLRSPPVGLRSPDLSGARKAEESSWNEPGSNNSGNGGNGSKSSGPSYTYTATPVSSDQLSGARYQPTQRVSRPMSVLRPITPDEINFLQVRHLNPLRKKLEKQMGKGVDHFGGGAEVENAGEVANHYNRRLDVGVRGREQSRIFPLRKFNNWIKSVLIGRFNQPRPALEEGAPPETTEARRRGRGPRVLELGCGKGGDLAKWARASASELVMVDIAAKSVEDAKSRYFESRYSYKAEFYDFDCFSVPLAEKIPEAVLEPLFDNVSLQFCMHYAWSNVQHVRIMLENVAKYLRKGGIFIATIPDDRKLRERLDSIPAREDEEEIKFGNSIYSVTFAQRTWQMFGSQYHFYLEDAVEDVPEYVVDWTQLESLAIECGLKCVYRKNFSEIFDQERNDPEFGQMLGRMKVVDQRSGDLLLDDEMWEAATIYQGFAFEKVR